MNTAVEEIECPHITQPEGEHYVKCATILAHLGQVTRVICPLLLGDGTCGHQRAEDTGDSNVNSVAQAASSKCWLWRLMMEGVQKCDPQS